MMPENENSGLILLRPVTREDIEPLQELYRQTIELTCNRDYDDEQRMAWKKGTENTVRWLEAVEYQYFLVAEIDGAIAGFGSLRDGHYVDFMYTSNGHLRRGVASCLYNALEARALEAGTSTMTSDVSKTARAFFEKKGYTVLKENVNLIRGVEIRNFRMQKILGQTTSQLRSLLSSVR